MSVYKDGLAEDKRPEEEKKKDYQHPEGAIPIEWVEKTSWKSYTPREQDGSLSCMAQAGAKALETHYGQVMSAHPPYRNRSNFPEGGMFLQDLGDVFKWQGTTTEALDPSQFQGETEMNRAVTVETPYKVKGYYFVNPTSIDSIAEAIEVAGHCILVIHCYRSEWLRSTPLYNGKPQAGYDFGHGVCEASDYLLKDGVKTIIIDDSTGRDTSLNGQRFLTEEFLKHRAVGAMYFIFQPPVPKTIRGGDKGEEVKQLQTLLNKKLNAGLVVDGIFGILTQKKVQIYQINNGLKADGIVGKLTWTKLLA